MSAEELVAAAAYGEAEEVRRLLAGGARADEPDEYGSTALYRAAVQGRAEIVRMLLAAGADPDHESGGDGEGLPLCAAAVCGHLDVVDALLDGGADPDRREDVAITGRTALHWAASTEHLAVVRALLAGGAAPDVEDAIGRTALSHAAQRGATAVVRTLLDHGADPAHRDRGGRSPADFARPYVGRDIEAELLAEVTVPPGGSVAVRRERSEGGDEGVVVEVRGERGDLRSGRTLGTGHAEIVRLLESLESLESSA
ncbi:ankyrin repeat domain-containing protein [Nonomuraea sp. SMC257]|uniref:Ankyrin repeat domain-containing protein n=1 Tax=Nonomuraea montanisoli TaxID=2741721 RepID=A0A7Y6M135_9ACTN|nr:ankyrin repeat domain-containing protein [Nonomuraea montanisoli]NUW30016.1 ankyrin repeat domain-containing protein [Nonomuraea montanisoli]